MVDKCLNLTRTDDAKAEVAFLTIPIVIAGALVLSIIERSAMPAFVALTFYLFGVLIGPLTRLYTSKTFAVSYGVLVVACALVQVYAFAALGVQQSTTDARTFYSAIENYKNDLALEQIALAFDSPLAVLTWQVVYRCFSVVGAVDSISLAVLFNSFLMSVSVALLSKQIYSLVNKSEGLMVVAIALSCGLFYLFSTVILRDCFLFLISSIFVSSYINWAKRPNFSTLIIYGLAVVLCTSAVVLIRREFVFALWSLFSLSFLVSLSERYGKAVGLLSGIVLLAALGVLAILSGFLDDAVAIFTRNSENYHALAMSESGDSSLGARFLLGQPTPVRLLLGSFVLIVNPIPLWINMYWGSAEYLILRNFNGIFMAATFPVFISGCLSLVGGHVLLKPIKTFLVAGFFLGLVMTAMTSLEVRHLGQFYPFYFSALALFLLEGNSTKYANFLNWIWLVAIAGLHLAWLFIKFI